MAKVEIKLEVPEMQKVLVLYKGEGAAFGCMEVEIDKNALLKHGNIVSKVEPDIWQVFRGQLERKAKEIFGI